MELDLGYWKNNEVKLAFWDSLHGEDHVYTLHPDGTVTNEAGEQVDLVVALLALLRWHEARLEKWLKEREATDG